MITDFVFVPPDIDPGSAVQGFIVQQGINYNELTSNLFATYTKKISEDFTGSLLIGNQITDIKNTVGFKPGRRIKSG